MWLELVDEGGLPRLINLDNVDKFVRAIDPENHRVAIIYSSGQTEEILIAWGDLANKVIQVQYKSWGCT